MARMMAQVAAQQNTCKSCHTSEADGFRCASVGAQHVRCTACNTNMPASSVRPMPATLPAGHNVGQDPRSCFVCSRHFCNAYWQATSTPPVAANGAGGAGAGAGVGAGAGAAGSSRGAAGVAQGGSGSGSGGAGGGTGNAATNNHRYCRGSLGYIRTLQQWRGDTTVRSIPISSTGLNPTGNACVSACVDAPDAPTPAPTTTLEIAVD
jgi:hypothetical protein